MTLKHAEEFQGPSQLPIKMMTLTLKPKGKKQIPKVNRNQRTRKRSKEVTPKSKGKLEPLLN